MNPRQCIPIQIISGHKDVVRSIVILENGYFLTCSHDGSLKLWNTSNFSQMIKRFSINNDFVINALRISKTNLILSIHSRGIVCVWKLNNGLCLKKLQICEKEIYCTINLRDYGLIAFGTSTGRVIFYNVFTSTCVLSIQEENSISCLFYSYQTLLVATREKVINLYSLKDIPNLKAAEAISMLQNEKKQISLPSICSSMVLVDNQTLIAGTTEGIVFVFNLTNYSLSKEIFAHRQTVINLKILNNNLYSTGYDGCVIRWDISTFQKQIRYFGHRYAVYAINTLDDFLITAGADQQIMIWNLNDVQNDNISNEVKQNI